MQCEFSYDELFYLEAAMLDKVLEAKQALSAHGPFQTDKGRKLLRSNIEQLEALRNKVKDYLRQAQDV